MKRALLLGGIASSLLYAAMLIFVPMADPAYDSASQAVSELSAIGAPTRSLWVPLGFIYTLLLAGFGWTVWRGSGANRPLRIAGICLFLQGATSVYWPPMQMRGEPFALTDALHIAWAIVTVLLMFGAIGFGGFAFGGGFRAFSVAVFLVQIFGGTMTGLDGPKLAQNLPTPWLGVWERIDIAAFLLWVVVFASLNWSNVGRPSTIDSLKNRHAVPPSPNPSLN